MAVPPSAQRFHLSVLPEQDRSSRSAIYAGLESGPAVTNSQSSRQICARPGGHPTPQCRRRPVTAAASFPAANPAPLPVIRHGPLTPPLHQPHPAPLPVTRHGPLTPPLHQPHPGAKPRQKKWLGQFERAHSREGHRQPNLPQICVSPRISGIVF